LEDWKIGEGKMEKMEKMENLKKKNRK